MKCPYRTSTITTPSNTVEGESYTTTDFMECLGHDCPYYSIATITKSRDGSTKEPKRKEICIKAECDTMSLPIYIEDITKQINPQVRKQINEEILSGRRQTLINK